MDVPLDLSVLPTLLALTVFVCCFRPLVRRAGPHTNVWLAGWGFLLLHYVALLTVNSSPSSPQGDLYHRISLFIATTAVQVCALCFVVASIEARITYVHRFLVAELALPVFLQSLLYTLGVTSYPVAIFTSLLFLAPAVHLLIFSRHRSRSFIFLAIASALLALVLIPVSRFSPNSAVDIVLCSLFLSAAYLTFAGVVRLTRGTGLMVGGLALWGLSYLLVARGLPPVSADVARSLLDLPRFLVAAGMILSLLDEYVGHTESLALHDPLTGLPNRRLFENRLEQALEDSARTRTPIACLVIDADNFKYINDTFGHPVGDGLLQALAKRLSWNLGPRDMLARTGGDEFTAVLVEAADEYHVRFIAGAMMAAGCVPVSIQHHAIDVRISIGIAVSPQDAGDGTELHKAADDAMYRAKRRGGSVVAFANEELPQIHAV